MIFGCRIKLSTIKRGGGIMEKNIWKFKKEVSVETANIFTDLELFAVGLMYLNQNEKLETDEFSEVVTRVVMAHWEGIKPENFNKDEFLEISEFLGVKDNIEEFKKNSNEEAINKAILGNLLVKIYFDFGTHPEYIPAILMAAMKVFKTKGYYTKLKERVLKDAKEYNITNKNVIYSLIVVAVAEELLKIIHFFNTLGTSLEFDIDEPKN
jgi:hypothetical protein